MRRIVSWGVLVVVASGFAFGSGEVMVRLLPYVADAYASRPFRQYDATLGVSLVPGAEGPHHRGCFRGEISINGLGMRDRERSIRKPPGAFRIALLGDSVIEAAHVQPVDVVNIRMEEKLGARGGAGVEVLNFGIAGIGTTQELLVFEERVRPFDVDVVVLAFLVSNDVMNNSSSIQPRVYGWRPWYAPYFDLDGEGGLRFRGVKARDAGPIRRWLEAHSVLVYYLNRVLVRLSWGDPKPEGLPLGWGVFGQPPKGEWADAWEVTERVLVLLRESVAAAGAQLLVVGLPESFEMDPDWYDRERPTDGRVAVEFEPDAAMRRLGDIARRNGIEYERLGPDFVRYRDRNRLEWPYFSFECDTHFSAIGHEVLADVISDKLLERGLVPMGEMSQGDANGPDQFEVPR